jgi:GT2 family glycosyltransferase
VFVYSNGCTDDTLDLISDCDQKYQGRFSYYRSNENEFFVKPNNKIIVSCVPDDVVLLNNDVEIVDPNWLHELNFSAYSAPWIGASGCMVLDQDGKISEAGAKMNEDGIGFNLGRGDSPDNPAHNQVKYVDYVSGCCLYMKRSSIDLIGSLDEDFHPMYYEDSAWQFKLRNEGYKTVYTPRTRIIHKEGSSAGTDLNTGMKKFQAINREKFKKKFSSK